MKITVVALFKNLNLNNFTEKQLLKSIVGMKNVSKLESLIKAVNL